MASQQSGPSSSKMLETIAFTIESCHIAQDCGAHRIELCSGAAEGGTTPSAGFIKAARKILRIPLYVMIRPRGGDFLYSKDEFDLMETDIRLCKNLGCDGVVFGMLNTDGSIDKRIARLNERAYPMGVTFHRAFDRCSHPSAALEKIIEYGCERILTSGQQPTAVEGASLIADLIKQAGNRVIIMPGSGVRSDNVKELAERTGAREFHTSARAIKTSEMQYSNAGMKETLQAVTVDANEIQSFIKVLSQIHHH